MKFVKGFTKQVNQGKPEFITEEEYCKLTAEYKEKCDNMFIVSVSEDYCTTGYRFDSEHRVVYLAWAYYPKF